MTEHPEHARCSGLAASWCPIHGDCTCAAAKPGEPRHLNDPTCILHRPTPDESGSVVIFLMGILMVVILLSGLCLDIWRAVAAERSLAAAVDSAAAAGANGIDEPAYRSSGAVQLDPVRAEALAGDNLSSQDNFPGMEGVTISATAARVTVTASMTIQLTLTRIFLRGDLPISATADAQPRRTS